MGKIKKYVLIALALVALFVLSSTNRAVDKAGPCCPFSVHRIAGSEK
jgi:hypothetical protein